MKSHSRIRIVVGLVLLAPWLLASAAVRAEEPAEALSKFLEPLRKEHAKTLKLVSEVRIYVNSGTTDKDKIRALGDRILLQLAANRTLLAQYETASTRFGMQEEYDLVADMVNRSGFLGSAYGRLTGVPAKPPTEEEQQEARKKIRAYLLEYLQPVVAQKLGSQGLAELLTAESFEEAVGIARGRVTDRILEDLDGDIRLFVETGLRGGSLESYVRNAGRRLIARYVATLLAKVTTNAIVIDFVAGSILRWIGPKLKRALRPKGDLEPRTRRSIEVLDEARSNLNQLDGRGALLVVRLALENARAAQASTHFLEGDLERAKRTDLKSDLDAAKELLRKTIHRTGHRFLVASRLACEDIHALVGAIDDVIGQVMKMQEGMKPGKREPLVPPDEPAEKDTVAGRYEVSTKQVFDPEMQARDKRWLNLVGNAKEVDFEFRGHADPTSSSYWHWKGHLTWTRGTQGKRRTLSGQGVDQADPRRREERSMIVLEKDDYGIWRAVVFMIGGNMWYLEKERREIPR